MRKFGIVLLLLLLAGGFALAQERTTGTLEGVVADADGNPIDGAVVTIIGPQGTRTAITDAEGRYAFRGLSPGSYSVKAEAEGFGAVVQSDVDVFIGRRTQVPFALQKGIQEEVRVESQAPVVDLKSTTTGESVKVDDFAPYVPLGRNLVSVFTIAPGVTDGGGTGTTNAAISGSSGLENAYFVDGVNITNNGYGALGAYSIVYGSLGTGVTYDFLEEVQVKTGGFEAEYGQAGGGIVNTVVKSGTNDYTLDVSWYEEPTSLEGVRGERIDAPNIANVVDTSRRDIALSSGGPILEDRLFYFAAYNPVETEATFKLTSGDPTVLYDLDGDGTATDSFNFGETITGGRTPAEVTRKRSIDNYAAKLTFYATPNHKLELTGFGDPSDGDVGPQAPTTFLRNLTDPTIVDPLTGATGLDWGGDQLSLKYQGVWSSNFFSEVQLSTKDNHFKEVGPGTQFRFIFDVDANTTRGGAGFYEDLKDESDQFSFKNTHVFGPVELSYGYQQEDINWAQPRLRSGPTYTAYFPNLVENANGERIFAQGCTTFALNDPACYTPLQSTTGASISYSGSSTPSTTDDQYEVTRTVFTEVGQPTDATEKNAFVQATWDVTPTVTVKAGLRWTEQELTGTGNETLPIGTLPISGVAVGGISTTLTAQSYKFDSEIAPRLGVTWDVLGDGRHKLYGNYGEYYQRVPSDLAVRAFSNEVGTTSELFADEGLTTPLLNTKCNFDTNGDGTIDGQTPCHLAEKVQGLAGGGSIILDGTQLDPNSEPGQALGSQRQLVSGEATKLPYTKEWLAGYAWEINDYTNVEVRYKHRELGRVLEDVQFASNEQAQNLFRGSTYGLGGGNCDPNDNCGPFPGHGLGAFGAYVFANVGGNVSSNLFPDPQRDYDAWEVVFNRRFRDGWMAYANYTMAELNGNYEGSFRNDNGQSDPFLTSLFDFPAASAVDTNNDGNFDSFPVSQTMIGQYTSGPLNTERRHILNAFLSKQFDFGLNVGARLSVKTGQPRFPLLAHPAYRNAGEIPGFDPIYWWRVNVDVDNDGLADGSGIFTDDDSSGQTVVGANSIDYDGDNVNDVVVGIDSGPRLWGYTPVSREFFGRNPTEVTLDLHASYDLDLRDGQSKLTFILDIFNLFDDHGPVGFDNNIETRPGNPNPDFLKANQFQVPRNVRLGVKFSY